MELSSNRNLLSPFRGDRGASIVEYAILLLFLSLLAISGVRLVGLGASSSIDGSNSKIAEPGELIAGGGSFSTMTGFSGESSCPPTTGCVQAATGGE